MLTLLFFVGLQIMHAEQPVIQVRLTNPQIDYTQGKYIVDVEFQSNSPKVRLFAMNVRFYHEYGILEFDSFTGFIEGYGAANPNPPLRNRLAPNNGSLFGFINDAVYINGAVQLINPNAPATYISELDWTRIFSVSFNFRFLPPGDIDVFKPAIIWDLEKNPAAGGFAPGSEGVVITIVDPRAGLPSLPTEERVVHHNWQYR